MTKKQQQKTTPAPKPAAPLAPALAPAPPPAPAPAPAPAPVPDAGGQLLLPGVKPEPIPPSAPRTDDVIWTWPGKSRCPRCGSVETVRVADDGRKQYRKCQRAICRHPFTVIGTKV